MTRWLDGQLGFEEKLSLGGRSQQEVATGIKGTRRYKGVTPSNHADEGVCI